MGEEFAKIEKLSAEVLRLSRNTLLINLRFMDAALAELEQTPSMPMRGIATDGRHLIYNPMDVLKAYADERYTASFISRYGCPEYFKHNKGLLLYERHKDIIREIEILNIED